MEIKAINFEELRKYESFTTIEQMDESIRDYTEHLRQDVAQSVVDVLWCLGRSSLRLVGMSFMKQQTIAKLTGYSRKTVNKALKTLEAFGVIDSVRTQTKKGRPSVKVVRILPFCLDRLHQTVTSNKANETNNDATLKPIKNFEPINTESIKQESNNISDNQSIIEKVSKLSTTIDLDGNLKNIVRMLSLKLGEKVKNGLQIESFGAYCEKVLANEIRRFAVKQKIEESKRRKEEEKRRLFDNFVMKNFGDRFEDLGQFVKDEAIRMYKEATQPVRRKVPFYNWLED